tara:strand:- start:569 stop:778 length:210 start_codon:yes stop_codon:yes gene_type:complete
MKDFKNTVDKKAIKELSLRQLKALNNLIDGKATAKDRKILKDFKDSTLLRVLNEGRYNGANNEVTPYRI